jgi:hypothetical protein
MPILAVATPVDMVSPHKDQYPSRSTAVATAAAQGYAVMMQIELDMV